MWRDKESKNEKTEASFKAFILLERELELIALYVHFLISPLPRQHYLEAL